MTQAVKSPTDSGLAGPCQSSSEPPHPTSMEDCVHQEEGERKHRFAGITGGLLPWIGCISCDSMTAPWWPASGASPLFSGPAKLRYLCVHVNKLFILEMHTLAQVEGINSIQGKLCSVRHS